MRFARTFYTLPALLTCITAIGTNAQQAVRNPGFEEGPATGVPEGWSAPGAPSTVIEVVTEDAHEGSRAVRLSRGPGSDPSQFGTLLQSVDAAPFRGQRVRLRGWVRTDATAATITGLWLRVDRPNRARGFFDNMADRPILITAVADDVAEVRPGNVVLRIDGRPARDTILEVESLISAATPQWRRYRAMRTLLVGPQASTLDLEVRSADATTRLVTLHRGYTPQSAPVETRPEPVAEVRPGIFYVDLTRTTNEQFMAALPRLENGNVNPFTLPGGYNVRWTGMKVLKHDGSQHHGVGIAPTIPATRTIEGVAAGRNELLDLAIEVLGRTIDGM